MSDENPNSERKYADRLIERCKTNPEEAAVALLQISNRICANDLGEMNAILAKLHDMEDGIEASELSGVDQEFCGDMARLMCDVFVLPILISTLNRQGLMLMLPNQYPNEAKRKNLPCVSPQQGEMTLAQARELMWQEAAALEEQIKGLLGFQVATDKNSAYGQLILKMATTMLAEIKVRKTPVGKPCQ